MLARKQKIAIVGVDVGSGEDERQRWQSVRWDASSDIVNLHDFDKWVLFAPTAPTDVADSSVAWCIDAEYAIEALHRGTRIYVVGDPRGGMLFRYLRVPFLHWTGMNFDWNSARGDTIYIEDAANSLGVRDYLFGISNWNYALKDVSYGEAFRNTTFGQAYLYGGGEYTLKKIPLAVNRHRESISFALRLESSAPATYEHVVFLPTGNVDPVLALHKVLKDVLQIAVKEEPPAWLKSIVAPGQDSVDNEIQELQEQLTTASTRLEQALHARDSMRECLEVLYQTGEPLEVAVELLLYLLGGTVSTPMIKGECDRFLTVRFGDTEHKAVIEIKGTRNSHFSIQGLRQVKEWRDNAHLATESDEEFRAIFIGNSSVKLPPDERPDPFSEQWIKNAKRFEVSCTTTHVLYRAFCAHREGRLDTETFWRSFFETNGIFDLDEVTNAAIVTQPPTENLDA